MWFHESVPQSPFVGLGVLLLVVYFVAYAIGFSVGTTRSFKWIASIAGGLFFVLFGMASGESQIGGMGLLFILSIPVLGWTVPFAIGGVVRRLTTAYFPRVPVSIKVFIAVIGSLALPTMAFHRVILDEYFPPNFQDCVERGFTATLGGRRVRIPFTIGGEVLLSNGKSSERQLQMWDKAEAARLCRGSSDLGEIERFNIDGYIFTHEWGQRWVKDVCVEGVNSLMQATCDFAKLSTAYDSQVDFELVPPHPQMTITRQAELWDWVEKDRTAQRTGVDGITIWGVMKYNKYVSNPVVSVAGVEAADRRPLLFTCRLENQEEKGCGSEEVVSDHINRRFGLSMTMSEVGKALPAAHRAAIRLTEEMFRVQEDSN